jgi:hypothetical protein
MPAILQKLAQHAPISKAMSICACLSADEIRTDLWNKHGNSGVAENGQEGNTLGNTRQKQAGDDCPPNGCKLLPSND